MLRVMPRPRSTAPRVLAFVLLGALTALPGLVACQNPAVPASDPLGVAKQPRRFTVEQRDTHTVPGTVGRISLRIGDVETGGFAERVEVIDHADESTLATRRELPRGGWLSFEVDGVAYQLVLIELDASHILHDTATFELRLAP